MNKPIYFEGLNSLRFICAFMLILYHSSLDYKEQFCPSINLFIHNLIIGVDFFFVISGFIITFLLILEKKQTHSINILYFYIRRGLRIFPIYFAIVLTAYLKNYSNNVNVDFLQYLCFMGNFWQIKMNSWPSIGALVPLWSLCVEEQFYLIIPVLIWFTPLKQLKFLFFGLIGASIFFRMWISYSTEYNWMTIYCHPISRADVLLIGSILAYYYDADLLRVNINKKLYFLFFSLLILVMLVYDSTDFTNIARASIGKYLYLIPLVFLFLSFVLKSKNNFKVIEWLKTNKCLNYLGEISFGLYIYQGLMASIIVKIPFVKNSFWLYLVSLFFFLCSCFYYFI